MNTAQVREASQQVQETVTRTRRWIRVNPPVEDWWPWGILPLLGLALLVLFAWFYFASAEVESDVARRAKENLTAEGFGWAEVKADGQELFVRGTSPGPVSERLIAAVARSTECDTMLGLRQCPTHVTVKIREGDPPPIEPAPIAPAASDRPPESVEPTGPARSHDFTFEVLGQEVILRGEVPTEHDRRRLVEAAGLGFKSVVDELRVTNAGATAMYSRASKSALEVLALLISGRAAWLKGKFGVAGVVAEGREAELRKILDGFGGDALGETQLLLEKEATTCDEDFSSILTRSKIQFATGSAEIREDSMSILRELAEIAKRCPVTLQIEGHTDSTGRAEFNEQLSLRRADSVSTALTGLGIPENDLVALGFGQRRPIAANDTSAGRAKNRRIEIRIRR